MIKYVFALILFSLPTLGYCEDGYVSFPTSVESVQPKQDLVSTEGSEDKVTYVSGEELDFLVTKVKYKQEKKENYVNNLEWSLGGVLTALMGFLGRYGYIWYQSKMGQLYVKHVKNKAQDVEDDIIDSISKITDLETGERARERLRYIQSRMLDIAEDKLGPKTK